MPCCVSLKQLHPCLLTTDVEITLEIQSYLLSFICVGTKLAKIFDFMMRANHLSFIRKWKTFQFVNYYKMNYYGKFLWENWYVTK